MTGIGTQLDPFAVDNFGDFLAAVAVPDAYVRVSKNIDVSLDPDYRAGMTDRIEINCAHVFAYERAIISGVLVDAQYMFYCSRSGGITIENIDFLHCLHKYTNGNVVASIYSSASSVECTFKNCNFSIAKIVGNGSQNVTTNNGFDHCSFNIKYLDVHTTTSILFSPSNMHACAICIDGAKVKTTGIAGQSHIIRNATQTSIVGVIEETDSSTRVFYNCGNCYAALEFRTVTTLTEALAKSTNFAVTDISSGTVSSADMLLLTSEQAKSKDYLLSIGFLP